jgi:hypothetical protein
MKGGNELGSLKIDVGEIGDNKSDEPEIEQKEFSERNNEEHFSEKNKEYLEYIELPKPMSLPQSSVYKIILDAVYKNQDSIIKFPAGCGKRLKYILLIPLTHS